METLERDVQIYSLRGEVPAVLDVQTLILEYLNTVQEDIKAMAVSKGMNATGRTLASLETFKIGATGGELRANENIRFLETGRGPTGDGAGAGSPTLVEALQEWAQAKGLAINAFAVAKTIHKHGTRLYRQGGNSGVLSVPMREEKIEELFQKVTASFLYQTSTEIFSPFTGIQFNPTNF